MKSEIINLLMTGKFDKAARILTNTEVIPEGIDNWVYDTSNITLYCLSASILIDKESAEEHAWASYLMAMPLCAYNGAYSLGLYHLRRARALDPSNLEYKRFSILYHDIPEQLIKKDEAIQIAREVLQEDPECGVSLNVLERYGLGK